MQHERLAKTHAPWVQMYFHVSINTATHSAQQRTYSSSCDRVHTLLHTVPSAALCVSAKSLMATPLLQK